MTFFLNVRLFFFLRNFLGNRMNLVSFSGKIFQNDSAKKNDDDDNPWLIDWLQISNPLTYNRDRNRFKFFNQPKIIDSNLKHLCEKNEKFSINLEKKIDWIWIPIDHDDDDGFYSNCCCCFSTQKPKQKQILYQKQK